MLSSNWFTQLFLQHPSTNQVVGICVVEEDWKREEDRSIKSSLSLNVGTNGLITGNTDTGNDL